MTHAAGDNYANADDVPGTVGEDKAPGIDEVRADIESTRADLADTVDALSAKLDVKQQARARANDVKQQAAARVQDVRQRAADAVGKAPAPVQNALHKSTETVAPVAQQVGQKAGENRQQVLIGAGAFVLLLLARRRRKAAKKRKAAKAAARAERAERATAQPGTGTTVEADLSRATNVQPALLVETQ